MIRKIFTLITSKCVGLLYWCARASQYIPAFFIYIFFNSAGKKIVGPITKGAEVLPFVSNFLKFVLNSQSGPLNLLSKNCKN